MFDSYDGLLAFSIGGLDGVQAAMLALAMAGLTLLMISTRNKFRNRAATPRTNVRERMARHHEESQTRDDLRAVMLELDEVSRQAHARLDTKFAKLETVIRDADQRIADLERLLREQRGEERRGERACDVVLPAEHPAGAPSEREAKAPGGVHDEIYQLADRGLAASGIALQLNQPVGEIELILSLRTAQRSAPTRPTAATAPHTATPS